jgi:molybdate/tungstate transport system substrate-binding protein
MVYAWSRIQNVTKDMARISSLLLIFLLNGFFVCSQKDPKNVKGELIVFHAGSLSVPLKQVATEFNKVYPDIKISMESAGSVASARKITDLGKRCDIMASADHSVIDNMLIPKYADWNVKFVTNELCIVYTSKSRYAGKINSKNWFDILTYNDVSYGRADPNADPCGYRTVLTLQLAEKYYKKPGLANKIMSKDMRFIRPKEVDLLALLESSSLDYIFIYKSVAIQHNLKYLELPDEINLKDPEFNDFYSTASTEINGSEPGKKVTVKGEAMIYGITILNDAPNKEAATLFVSFLLEKNKGMRIMEHNGQPALTPYKFTNKDKLPLSIRKIVNQD